MDMVQSGAVRALELRDKQQELRQTDEAYIKVRLPWHHDSLSVTPTALVVFLGVVKQA